MRTAVFTTIALALLLPPQAMAQKNMSKMSDAEFYQYVVDFSGKPDWEDPRAALSGGYVTPLGTQFHPICFDYYEKTNPNRSLDRTKIDASVREAAEKIISCAERHPELSEAYLKPALQHLQRAVITCSKKIKYPVIGFNAGAVNITASSIAPLVLNEDERAGIDFFVGEDANRSMTAAFRTTIAVTRRDDFPVVSSSTLLHELLHSTGANNHGIRGHAHRYEARTGPSWSFSDPKATNACSLWHYSDRISFIENLCTASNVEESVFHEMSGCGQKRCTDVFTKSDVSWIEKGYSPAKNLTKKQATSLCTRLYSHGACEAWAHDRLLRLQVNDAKLGKIRGKMRQMRDKLMPTHLGLSNEFIDALELRPEIDKLRDNRCFKRLFIETKSGFTARERWKKQVGAGGAILVNFHNYFEGQLAEKLHMRPKDRAYDFGGDKTINKYCDSKSFARVRSLIHEVTAQAQTIGIYRATDLALVFIERGQLSLPEIEALAEGVIEYQARKETGEAIPKALSFMLNFAGQLAQYYNDHYRPLYQKEQFKKGDTDNYDSIPSYDCKRLGLDPLSIMKKLESPRKTLQPKPDSNDCP